MKPETIEKLKEAGFPETMTIPDLIKACGGYMAMYRTPGSTYWTVCGGEFVLNGPQSKFSQVTVEQELEEALGVLLLQINQAKK